jgi:hypothetical protein
MKGDLLPNGSIADSVGPSVSAGSPWHLRCLDLLTWATLAVLATRTAVALWRVSLVSDRLPQWDMAKYGVAGVRLARAVSDLDPVSFVTTIHRMSLIPPVFPLLEMPALLLLGFSFIVPRGIVGALFLIAVGAMLWTGRQLDREHGPLVGAFAALLLCTSPFAHLFGTLIMLEIPGSAILIFAIGWYARSVRTGRPRDLRIACALATALFFCKYNYGLMWLLPVFAHEAWLRSGSVAAAVDRARSTLGSVFLRRPWHLFTALCLATVAAVWLSGPWQISVAGHTVSAGSAGNLVYGLYILALLRLVARPRRNAEAVRSWWRRRDPRSRTMALWVALPIALWMLAPSHTKDFFRLVENRSSGLTLLSADSLLFHPRSFMDSYSVDPILGLSVLLVALILVVGMGRLPAHLRPVPLALAAGLAAALGHPFKLPRFFFTVAPLVWLSAGLAVAIAVDRLLRAAPRAAVATVSRSIALIVIAAGAATATVDSERLRQGFDARTVPRSTRPVVDAIADQADEPHGSVLLGHWNQLSPGLVEWLSYQRRPGIDRVQVPRRLRGGGRSGDIAGRLAADRTTERVLVLDAAAGTWAHDAGFGRETAWLDATRVALAVDPRYELESERRFPASGYELKVYTVSRSD